MIQQVIPLPIGKDQLVFILGLLIGFNTGWSFSDFDEWVRGKFPDDFKDSFTYYVITRLLKATHHYMWGIIIMVLFYPPSGLISTFGFAFGLGLFLEETDVFLSELGKVMRNIKKLRRAGGSGG